jgi:hypothetical protein
MLGRNILLVDLVPQAHSTIALGSFCPVRHPALESVQILLGPIPGSFSFGLVSLR